MSWDGFFTSLEGVKSESETRGRRVRGLIAHLRRGVLELQGAPSGPEPNQSYGVYDREVAPLLGGLRRELGLLPVVEPHLADLDALHAALAGIAPAGGRTPFELAMQALVTLGSVEREVERAERAERMKKPR